jgi:hypothetical protein
MKHISYELVTDTPTALIWVKIDLGTYLAAKICQSILVNEGLVDFGDTPKQIGGRSWLAHLNIKGGI